MLNADRVSGSGALLPPITTQARDRPRVTLLCGTPVCHALDLAAGTPMATALEIACELSRSARLAVSLSADGPIALLPGLAATALSYAGLQPGRLEIAIQAAALEAAELEALLALSALRDHGVGVALSGFGTRQLALLAHLPLSAVILEASAIDGLPGCARVTAGLHCLLDTARRYGLRVIATGIEQESQRALLSGLGCQEGEGSLFGPGLLDSGMLDTAPPEIGRPEIRQLEIAAR